MQNQTQKEIFESRERSRLQGPIKQEMQFREGYEESSQRVFVPQMEYTGYEDLNFQDVLSNQEQPVKSAPKCQKQFVQRSTGPTQHNQSVSLCELYCDKNRITNNQHQPRHEPQQFQSPQNLHVQIMSNIYKPELMNTKAVILSKIYKKRFYDMGKLKRALVQHVLLGLEIDRLNLIKSRFFGKARQIKLEYNKLWQQKEEILLQNNQLQGQLQSSQRKVTELIQTISSLKNQFQDKIQLYDGLQNSYSQQEEYYQKGQNQYSQLKQELESLYRQQETQAQTNQDLLQENKNLQAEIEQLNFIRKQDKKTQNEFNLKIENYVYEIQNLKDQLNNQQDLNSLEQNYKNEINQLHQSNLLQIKTIKEDQTKDKSKLTYELGLLKENYILESANNDRIKQSYEEEIEELNKRSEILQSKISDDADYEALNMQYQALVKEIDVLTKDNTILSTQLLSYRNQVEANPSLQASLSTAYIEIEQLKAKLAQSYEQQPIQKQSVIIEEPVEQEYIDYETKRITVYEPKSKVRQSQHQNQEIFISPEEMQVIEQRISPQKSQVHRVFDQRASQNIQQSGHH